MESQTRRSIRKHPWHHRISVSASRYPPCRAVVAAHWVPETDAAPVSDVSTERLRLVSDPTRTSTPKPVRAAPLVLAKRLADRCPAPAHNGTYAPPVDRTYCRIWAGPVASSNAAEVQSGRRNHLLAESRIKIRAIVLTGLLVAFLLAACTSEPRDTTTSVATPLVALTTSAPPTATTQVPESTTSSPPPPSTTSSAAAADVTDPSLAVAPVEWTLGPFEPARRIYTIFTIAKVEPLVQNEVVEWSGRLVWIAVTVELCNVQLRFVDEGAEVLHFGDGYQTTEGCGENPTAMQDAFDKYGPPRTACLHIVSLNSGAGEYCGPLEDIRS